MPKKLELLTGKEFRIGDFFNTLYFLTDVVICEGKHKTARTIIVWLQPPEHGPIRNFWTSFEIVGPIGEELKQKFVF